jgi:hypothetical protein
VIVQSLQDRQVASGAADRAMTGLAAFRIGLGAAAWLAPRFLGRAFGVRGAADGPELAYMNRVFGIRAIALGTGYLCSRGEARALWHRLWLLCDGADTVMGIGMAMKGELRGVTAAQAIAITAGATGIDLAAMRQRRLAGNDAA